MTTRIFGRAIVSAGIVALLALLSPSEVWAHRCGPQTLKVKKDNTVWYPVYGHDYLEYQIIDKGDPFVAKIEPPMNNDDVDAMFKIVGAGGGVTMFEINWKSLHRQGICRVKVTVHE